MKYPLMNAAVIYLCVISLIAIVVTVSDKHRAQRQKWRIPESSLLLIAALGGSVAMLVSMLAVRHKTRHSKFMAGIPLILLFQLVILFWLMTRLG